MNEICKYYKHPKGCTCKDRWKCVLQLYPNVCTSNLYYAAGLEQECKNLKRDLQKGFNSFLKQKEELFKEIKCYHKALEEIEGIVSKDYYNDTWADLSIKLDKILDIINGFADGRNEISPDSEQIEHTVTESQMRNSVSVEQIQDNKAKGDE